MITKHLAFCAIALTSPGCGEQVLKDTRGLPEFSEKSETFDQKQSKTSASPAQSSAAERERTRNSGGSKELSKSLGSTNQSGSSVAEPDSQSGEGNSAVKTSSIEIWEPKEIYEIAAKNCFTACHYPLGNYWTLNDFLKSKTAVAESIEKGRMPKPPSNPTFAGSEDQKKLLEWLKKQ